MGLVRLCSQVEERLLDIVQVHLPAFPQDLVHTELTQFLFQVIQLLLIPRKRLNKRVLFTVPTGSIALGMETLPSLELLLGIVRGPDIQLEILLRVLLMMMMRLQLAPGLGDLTRRPRCPHLSEIIVPQIKQSLLHGFCDDAVLVGRLSVGS